eukprot:scaffold2053_cov106-Skeletonema_dohrnii-CCMP3373.AAC.14
MSTATEPGAVCASCGDDKKKLKKCGACDLVKYCGVECQRNHRQQHKRACKKRAAALKDELLFKQPESSHLGDCPICLMPLRFPTSQEDPPMWSKMSCCSKLVCTGCIHANTMRHEEEMLSETCPFCRKIVPYTETEVKRNEMKRVEANDPEALGDVGIHHFVAGEYAAAIEYFEKAAALGEIESHYQLSNIYHEGLGVEKDEKKSTHHLEQAAIGGHPLARHNLALREWRKGDIERAVKHFIIAATLGCDVSVEELKKFHAHGVVSKEDFAALLHAYQAAVDAMKSPEREAAANPKIRYKVKLNHNLGVKEWINGNIGKAAKHFIVSANLGCDLSLEKLKICYQEGGVSKEDFAAALRAHHAAVNAMKSDQRGE